MSKRVAKLEVKLPPERVETACRAAVESLAWELVDVGEGRLSAREDATRLCCHDSPVEIEIAVAAAPGDRTAITLAGSVAGIGPVSSRHLGAGLAGLAGAIRRSLA